MEFHGRWPPAISPVLCVSNSARKQNRNLGCGHDTVLGAMEEAGELKRPIYLVQLHQRATMFPFQLCKPTGSRLLSPTASHRTAQTLSAHQLNRTETPTHPLGTFLLEATNTASESQINRPQRPDHHSPSPPQHRSRGSSLSQQQKETNSTRKKQESNSRPWQKCPSWPPSALMPALRPSPVGKSAAPTTSNGTMIRHAAG